MVSRTTARSGAAIPNPRYPAIAAAATRSSTAKGLTSPVRPGTTSPAVVQQVAKKSGARAILNSCFGWKKSNVQPDTVHDRFNPRAGDSLAGLFPGSGTSRRDSWSCPRRPPSRSMEQGARRRPRGHWWVCSLPMSETPSGGKTPFWARFFQDPGHGPLPALLQVLTAMSGLIDAVSILGLGRVFVANMTGNIVFSGFALAHVPGFSLLASLAALVGVLIGAFLRGILVVKFAGHRGLLLRNACAVQFLLLAAAFAVVLPSGDLPGQGRAGVVAALLALSLIHISEPTRPY